MEFCNLPKSKFGLLLLILFTAPLAGITITGRLPGNRFKEDNPPRFGATMSFLSKADSVVWLQVRHVQPNDSIADELKRIAKGLKLKNHALIKLGLVEGTNRWLQYSFKKARGGGFIFITRKDNWIIYLVIFNLNGSTLSVDMPYIERYVKELAFEG